VLVLQRHYLIAQLLVLIDLAEVRLVSLSEARSDLIVLLCHVIVPVFPFLGLSVLLTQ